MTASTQDRFSPRQCRGARGLLGWTVDQLAEQSGVSPAAIRGYEAERALLAAHDVRALGEALNDGGVLAKPGSTHVGEGLRLVPDHDRIRNRHAECGQ
jgi:transcriptional regulator with XRE-family HTH domain